jgi:hypothetical protein
MKFYYPFRDINGWNFWISILCIGIAGGFDTDDEMSFEIFAGKLSVDYATSAGQFSIQAAIGDFAWVSFGFDGQQFDLGGRA